MGVVLKMLNYRRAVSNCCACSLSETGKQIELARVLSKMLPVARKVGSPNPHTESVTPETLLRPWLPDSVTFVPDLLLLLT